MSSRSPAIVIWSLTAVAGLAAAVCLAFGLGLDRADHIASIVSAVVGIVGLVGAVRTSTAARPETDAAPTHPGIPAAHSENHAPRDIPYVVSLGRGSIAAGRDVVQHNRRTTVIFPIIWLTVGTTAVAVTMLLTPAEADNDDPIADPTPTSWPTITSPPPTTPTPSPSPSAEPPTSSGTRPTTSSATTHTAGPTPVDVEPAPPEQAQTFTLISPADGKTVAVDLDTAVPNTGTVSRWREFKVEANKIGNDEGIKFGRLADGLDIDDCRSGSGVTELNYDGVAILSGKYCSWTDGDTQASLAGSAEGGAQQICIVQIGEITWKDASKDQFESFQMATRCEKA